LLVGGVTAICLVAPCAELVGCESDVAAAEVARQVVERHDVAIHADRIDVDAVVPVEQAAATSSLVTRRPVTRIRCPTPRSSACSTAGTTLTSPPGDTWLCSAAMRWSRMLATAIGPLSVRTPVAVE
jgi:hypothetical protein